MQMLKGIAIITLLAFVMTNGLGPVMDHISSQDGANPVPRDYYFRVRADKTTCDLPCTIHFWVETDDPMLILFRWDLNGDLVWDYPRQTGPDFPGDWVIDREFYYSFLSSYNGKVCVQGWDGVSKKTAYYYGSVFKGIPAVDVIIAGTETGWRFTPKVEIEVSSLGFWKMAGTYPGISVRLYDATTQSLLTKCTPKGTSGNVWDWCDLVAPISLHRGVSYIISSHKFDPYSPYWTGIVPSRVSWDNVTYHGAYRMQGGFWVFASDVYVPKVDMNYTVTIIAPDARLSCIDCDIRNPPPTVSLGHSTFDATGTLRVAGEKWHDVSAYLVDDDTARLAARIVRQPGKPQEASFPVKIDPTRGQMIRIVYTPDDDEVNGQPNGATPAWLTLRFDNGENRTFHHTFNVRHPGRHIWTVSLNQLLAGMGIRFTATATDSGLDDLTFIWDWGDGTPATISSFPNDGTSPFTVTDAQTHAYAMAGTFIVTLRVTDDDGGVSESSMAVILQ